MLRALIIVVLIFGFSGGVVAEEAFDTVLRFLFESAIETDRRQSYNWHYATKENPAINKRLTGKTKDGWPVYTTYHVWEKNPLVAGTSREQFDKIIYVTKDLVNAIPQMLPNKKISRFVYTCITLAELYVVRGNNIRSKKIFGFPEIWAISYSWKF